MSDIWYHVNDQIELKFLTTLERPISRDEIFTIVGNELQKLRRNHVIRFDTKTREWLPE